MKKDYLNWTPERGFYWENWRPSAAHVHFDETFQSARMDFASKNIDCEFGVRPIAKIMAKLLS